MNSDVFLSLSDHDRKAIGALTEDLSSHFSHAVVQLRLFGSKVRGEDTPDSDIDVLVITSHDEWALKHALLTRGARLSLEFDVLFNLYVISLDRWNWMKHYGYPLYRTIAKDGVDLDLESIFV